MDMVLLAVGLVLLVGGAAFAGLYLFTVRSRHDDEAAALQQALAETFARAPAVRAVEREAARLGRRVRIVDSLQVIDRRERLGA